MDNIQRGLLFNRNVSVNVSASHGLTKSPRPRNSSLYKSYRQRLFSKIGLQNFISKDCKDLVYVEENRNDNKVHGISDSSKWYSYENPKYEKIDYKYKRIANLKRDNVSEKLSQDNKNVVLLYPFGQNITPKLQAGDSIQKYSSTEKTDDKIKEVKPELPRIELSMSSKNPVNSKISRICNGDLLHVIVDLLLGSLKIFNSCNLNKIVHNLISDEKARQIKLLLADLLLDLDKSQRSVQPIHKDLEIMAPNGDTNKNRFPNDIKPVTITKENVRTTSISEIIAEYNRTFTKTLNKATYRTDNSQYLKRNKTNLGTFNMPETSILSLSKMIEVDQLKKTLFLNPFDDVVKSYYSSTDRRLLAVAKKANCTIEIVGPLKTLKFVESAIEPRDRATYKCNISGDNKTSIGKCLKGIRDTFPTTTIRDAKCY